MLLGFAPKQRQFEPVGPEQRRLLIDPFGCAVEIGLRLLRRAELLMRHREEEPIPDGIALAPGFDGDLQRAQLSSLSQSGQLLASYLCECTLGTARKGKLIASTGTLHHASSSNTYITPHVFSLNEGAVSSVL